MTYQIIVITVTRDGEILRSALNETHKTLYAAKKAVGKHCDDPDYKVVTWDEHSLTVRDIVDGSEMQMIVRELT